VHFQQLHSFPNHASIDPIGFSQSSFFRQQIAGSDFTADNLAKEIV
jgi:hypothetical protein